MHTSWCILGCRLVLLQTARGKCGWRAVRPAGSQAVMEATNLAPEALTSEEISEEAESAAASRSARFSRRALLRMCFSACAGNADGIRTL